MINCDHLDESDRDSQSAAGASADRQIEQLRSSATGLKGTGENFSPELDGSRLGYEALPQSPEITRLPPAEPLSLSPESAPSFFAHMVFRMAAHDHARRRLYTWTDHPSPFAPPAFAAPGWPPEMLQELRACKTQLDYQIWAMRWTEHLSGRISAQIRVSGFEERRNAARQTKKRD